MLSHVVVHEQAKPRHYHDPCYITGVILLWLTGLALYFFTIATLVDIGVFEYSVADANDDFEEAFTTESYINPAGWVFGVVWFLIFTYELVFLCYMISVVVRKSKVTGQKLYQVTAFIPVPVLYLYVINNVLLSAWYFVANVRSQVGSLIILLVDICIVLGAYSLTMQAMYHKYPKLLAAGFRREDKLVVAIVLNSIGTLLTWLIIATHVQLSNILVTLAGLETEMAAAIPLTMLIVIYAIYNFLDLAILEEYFRFLYGPHLPFVLATIGIVADNYSSERSLSVFQVGFMIVVVAVVPLKVCLDVYRERMRPRFGAKRLQYEQLNMPFVTSPMHHQHVMMVA